MSSSTAVLAAAAAAVLGELVVEVEMFVGRRFLTEEVEISHLLPLLPVGIITSGLPRKLRQVAPIP